MKNRMQYWQALDDKIFTEMTETIGNKKDARDYTDKMVEALKSFYEIYTDELVDWFANLYEPDIRFDMTDSEEEKKRYSGGAGFYYSNSARDNYSVDREGMTFQLLPDAETTAQVICGFLRHSGMLTDVNGDYREAFPAGEPEKIVRFIKALQDEKSGNFYHPQWLKIIDTPMYWDSRRSRDMTYSLSTLSAFGAMPTYNTPTGKMGDGIMYDGTKTEISAADITDKKDDKPAKAITTHPRLVSEETFAEYLGTLNLAGNSYFVGNELSALASELKQRDKEIGTEDNPRPLAAMLDKWLRDNQNPETGCWHDNVKHPNPSVYYPTNGLLKIAALYNTLELPFPNPLAASKSAFAVITDPQPIHHVCDLYNTWFIVDIINDNLKKYSGNPALAKQICSDVRIAAIPAVYATAEKMKGNRKPDGSFSYFPDHCSATSQNAPVAFPGTDEGDVNATAIFTYGILGFMFGALDFGRPVPICGAEDLARFKAIITERVNNSNK